MSKPSSEELVLYPFSGRQVEFLLTNPDYNTIVKAVLMVKSSLSDADSAALITKTIYPVGNEHGVVSFANGTEGNTLPLLVFTVVPAETQNLVVGTRLYTALKIWTNLASTPSSLAKGRRGVRVEAPGVFTTSSA